MNAAEVAATLAAGYSTGAIAAELGDGDGHAMDALLEGDVPLRFLATVTPAGELLPIVTAPGPLLGVHRRPAPAPWTTVCPRCGRSFLGTARVAHVTCEAAA